MICGNLRGALSVVLATSPLVLSLVTEKAKGLSMRSMQPDLLYILESNLFRALLNGFSIRTRISSAAMIQVTMQIKNIRLLFPGRPMPVSHF
jgi:hypothetical protein